MLPVDWSDLDTRDMPSPCWKLHGDETGGNARGAGQVSLNGGVGRVGVADGSGELAKGT